MSCDYWKLCLRASHDDKFLMRMMINQHIMNAKINQNQMLNFHKMWVVSVGPKQIFSCISNLKSVFIIGVSKQLAVVRMYFS